MAFRAFASHWDLTVYVGTNHCSSKLLHASHKFGFRTFHHTLALGWARQFFVSTIIKWHHMFINLVFDFLSHWFVKYRLTKIYSAWAKIFCSVI